MSDLAYSNTIPTEEGRYWMISGGIQKVINVLRDEDNKLYIEDNSNPFTPVIFFVKDIKGQWSQMI